MNRNLVKIDIVDDESFLKACDILHDSYCDLSTVEYNEKDAGWKAIFEREFFEDQDLMEIQPKFIFFYKVTFPIAKSELFLRGIMTYKMEDKSKIQVYSFNECQRKKNAHKFLFNEGMEMTFTFDDKPKGSLIDQELLAKKGTFYKWRNPFKRRKNANNSLKVPASQAGTSLTVPPLT